MHVLYNDGISIPSHNWDVIYANYLKMILQHGDDFTGRNGLTRSLFGASVIVDLRQGFPLTRLRKMPWKNLVREFLFDIGFDGNVEALGSARHFWDFLADENGELGASAYNRQWRRWPQSRLGVEVPNETLEHAIQIDQLKNVITLLRHDPGSRQGTVITHNPTAIRPACPPCHLAMQFTPRQRDGSLDLMVPARSNDMIVGFPLDIARYALMLEVVAAATGFNVGRVFMPSSNSHIYENCFEIAEELISRTPRPECVVNLPHSILDIDKLREDEFEIFNYVNPHPAIKVSVN
jgi:thymidylate synthase